MEISWTDRVRNKEVGLLHRDKEERNLIHTVKLRKANHIVHALRRNCLLDHVIEESMEGKIEETGRRGGRRNQLLHDLKEKRIRQVRSPLQRDFCTESHLMLPRFRYPLVSWGHPVDAYVFFLILPSLPSFPISFLQCRVLEGSFYVKCDH